MSTTPYPLDHYDHNKAMTSILYEIPTIYFPKYFAILGYENRKEINIYLF